MEGILRHIFGHDEPSVEVCLGEAAASTSLTKPRWDESRYHDICLDLAAGIPLWAVVDRFGLGLLGRFVMNCGHDTDAPVWKAVARDLEISAQVVETQVEALTCLRHWVAHHARLWMPPTSDTAKSPRLFSNPLKTVHHESMYRALMNRAPFLPKDQRFDFAQRIDDLTGPRPLSPALIRPGGLSQGTGLP